MVTREYDGLAGAGGVKDVCRQLSEALAGHGGCRVTVVLPRYGFVNPGTHGFRPFRLPSPQRIPPASDECYDSLDIAMDYAGEDRRERVSIRHREKEGVRIFLVEAERFAEKSGVYTYTAEEESRRSWQRQGSGHFDYFAMNILLQKAALALMMVLGEKPDVIHCQDGHAAVIPAMIREIEGYRHFFRYTGTVVTIHNAGVGYHQEVEDLHFARAVTGLPDRVIQSSLLDRAFDPFIAASRYALLNTVSEEYARELQETPEDSRTGWLGHALVRRGVNLAGITNGINPDDFDSTRPKKVALPAAFDVTKGRLKGKRTCKEKLLRSLNSRRKRARVSQVGRLALKPEQPLVTFIGRLTYQKGVDLMIESFEGLLREDREFQLLVLGSGEPELETRLTEMAEDTEYNGQICFLRGYDQELALKVYAAGDFFLIPSLFEPCGLTDYIAQLFGNVPVVHRVGGLVKVVDGQTGFSYSRHDADALAATVQKALDIFRTDPEKIKRIQKQAVQRIRQQYTWKKVMLQYLDLYIEAVRMACSAGSMERDY
jgi:starch synthase